MENGDAAEAHAPPLGFAEEDAHGRPLRGRVLLVTGAGQGVGEAVARLAALRGAAGVALCGRTGAKLERVAASLGYPALPRVADLARVEDCLHAVDRTVERFGALDVLVNAATGSRACRLSLVVAAPKATALAPPIPPMGLLTDGRSRFRRAGWVPPERKAKGAGVVPPERRRWTFLARTASLAEASGRRPAARMSPTPMGAPAPRPGTDAAFAGAARPNDVAGPGAQGGPCPAGVPSSRGGSVRCRDA